MKKVEAFKDGKGNIVITEDSFEMVLACLDNQKFVGEGPCNGDSLSVGKEEYYKTQDDIQDTIDKYNRECRKILHQKYVFETIEDGYFLTKKYEHQNKITSWEGEDVGKIDELFKNTIMKEEKPVPPNPPPAQPLREGIEKGQASKPLRVDPPPPPPPPPTVVPKPGPLLIERSLRCDYDYLTISEDGKNNRPWKKEEVEQIKNLFIKN